MKAVVFILCLITLSCQSRVKKDNSAYEMNHEYVKKYEDEILKDSLIKRTLKGDTNAYKEIVSIYGLSGHYNEYYYYSVLMAEDFNFAHAYEDLYLLLDNHQDTSCRTYHLANYYLLKARDKGVPLLNSAIRSRFGSDTPTLTSLEYGKNLKW